MMKIKVIPIHSHTSSFIYRRSSFSHYRNSFRSGAVLPCASDEVDTLNDYVFLHIQLMYDTRNEDLMFMGKFSVKL